MKEWTTRRFRDRGNINQAPRMMPMMANTPECHSKVQGIHIWVNLALSGLTIEQELGSHYKSDVDPG